ncbi:MAG: hypothetical protein JXB05_37365 [Myxococcaceae bacterium]|nr:hypothetical protein [Myxococcaceae bacterium]
MISKALPIVLLAWGMAGPAAAVEGGSRVFVPEARVKGSTEGEAELEVSLGYRVALDKGWDRQVRLSYEIGTQGGLAELFDPEAEELGASAPWNLGVTYSFLKLSTPYSQEEKLEAATAQTGAWCLCAQRCKDPQAEDKAFCELMAKTPMPENFCDSAGKQPLTSLPEKPPHPYFIDASKFCPAGVQHMEKETQAHKRQFPQSLNLGASVGRDEFKFLRAGEGTPPTLTPGTKVGANWSAGASAVWLTPLEDSFMSFEALLGFSSNFEPATGKARWCIPRGNVAQEGGSYPAETCKESILGEPSRVQALTGAFQIGNIDQKVNTYRVAAGVQGYVPLSSESEDAFRLSFAVPIYINFTGGDDYKGIIRVGPSVTYANKRQGESVTTFAVSLALLGQRQLFTRDFDEL